MSTQRTAFSFDSEFELYQERPPAGLVKRFLITVTQLTALLWGGGFAWARARKADGHGWRLKVILLRLVLLFVWPFMDKQLIRDAFPVQFRRRLERLGPTYIKLGQILSLREDLLPKAITDELKNLLDRLPVVSFPRFCELVEADLNRPISACFAWVDEKPLGSASIAQIHQARLLTGEEVVLKVVKPGIRETILRDTRLLRAFGTVLQALIGRYQPQRLINEFCDYTTREVDMRIEAGNAEMFAANFKDDPDTVFPKVYRAFSGRDVLCMEYLKGRKPDAVTAANLTPDERRYLVNLGISAIVRMFYEHGFFHADLHPGNLVILGEGKAAFIDLGMVGRVDDAVRKNMFYYNYALVMGDAAGAARHLAALTYGGRRSDPEGFRRAVEDVCRRWILTPNFKEFSVAQLILESMSLGAQYGVYFPTEILLLVKALVTFEGVGNLIDPEFNLAEVSRTHIRRIFLRQFNPVLLAQETLRGMPELIDVLVRSPLLLSEAVQLWQRRVKNPEPDPVTALKGVILAGFCLLAGAILAAAHMPWPAWGALFLVAVILAWRA